MKQVLVRPSFQDWCGNRLFTEGTSFNQVYREAFALWKTEAAKGGFQIDTWDCADLKSADVFWFLDLPSTKQEFEQIRGQLQPGTPLVLQILENPLLTIHSFFEENTKHFNAILSYEHADTVAKRANCVAYKLPNEVQKIENALAFADRKLLLLINSNRIEGLWATRQVGLAGIPLLGRLLSGWYCPPRALKEILQGELYSHRRKIARLSESHKDSIDIYGYGWNGEQISWFPGYPNHPYKTSRGKFSGDKLSLCANYRFVLSFENYCGNRGYISEKIFDPIFAGSVPVYLGDERITDYVPAEAFVDAKKFNDYQELFSYLQNCSEYEWQKMLEAGQNFIRSEHFYHFSTKAFVWSAMQVLRHVAQEQP